MKMRGCDISDQLMTSYSMLRHSVKWWRKLFSTSLHCASIMHIFFTKKKPRKSVPHDTFIEYLATNLFNSSLESRTLTVTRPRSPTDTTNHLQGRHFPSYIRKVSTKSGSKMCGACNFGKKQMTAKGYTGVNLPRKLTSYMCKICNVPLCIYPCFELYHTKDEYQNYAFRSRVSSISRI